MRERRKVRKTFRLKEKTGDVETYDVLDDDTPVGFFVIDLATGQVTDSSIGPFTPDDPDNRRMIASRILKYIKL